MNQEVKPEWALYKGFISSQPHGQFTFQAVGASGVHTSALQERCPRVGALPVLPVSHMSWPQHGPEQAGSEARP